MELDDVAEINCAEGPMEASQPKLEAVDLSGVDAICKAIDDLKISSFDESIDMNEADKEILDYDQLSQMQSSKDIDIKLKSDFKLEDAVD